MSTVRFRLALYTTGQKADAGPAGSSVAPHLPVQHQTAALLIWGVTHEAIDDSVSARRPRVGRARVLRVRRQQWKRRRRSGWWRDGRWRQRRLRRYHGSGRCRWRWRKWRAVARLGARVTAGSVAPASVAMPVPEPVAPADQGPAARARLVTVDRAAEQAPEAVERERALAGPPAAGMVAQAVASAAPEPAEPSCSLARVWSAERISRSSTCTCPRWASHSARANRRQARASVRTAPVASHCARSTLDIAQGSPSGPGSCVPKTADQTAVA